jgi:pyruvate formate lyase activating enzyme
MATCRKCGRVSKEIAEVLSLCADCVSKADDTSMAQLETIHARSRQEFGLPAGPPSGPSGIDCGLCQNKCRIAVGGRGYCGVRINENGQLKGGNPDGAEVSWYHDPLPTNCVADWVCANGSGAGYPQWACRPGPERGRMNLAVFYQACTFNCLFCQNWHYREKSASHQTRSARELAEAVTTETSCICYFGGDPTCQLPHALTASRIALEKNQNRILRICWETNGSMSPELLDEMMRLSVESGGCVKFDLKAMDANIHYALCGVEHKRTLENFAAAAKFFPQRPEPPPLIASTLLVPHYIEAKEVRAIASFIAKLDPDIPYALLGFHGDFLMTDLPPTSCKQAESCLAAATAAGLNHVRLGNVHLFR